MVKKGSIFSRIAERLRSSSGVRVSAGRGADGKSAKASAKVERVEGKNGGNVPSTTFAKETKSTRKMSEREEAMAVLGSHFQELTTLLRSSHGRMDDKLGQLAEHLPALGNQQLEILRKVAGHVERQNASSEQIARSLQGLPDMMSKVDQALQRAAKSEERTSATMREFQSTMDRIHSAMGRMVENSDKQTKATQSIAQQREESLKGLTSGIEKAQRDAVDELRASSSASLESLRRTHEDQSNRLQRVVQEHASFNKWVLVVLGILGLGMFAMIVMQLVK